MDYATDRNGFQLTTKIFEDFEVQLIRSPRAASGSEFLPARVIHLSTKKELWCFRKHVSAAFCGLAFLREINGEPVIMLATRKILFTVLPLHDLPHMQQLGEEFIGGRNLRDLITMKSTLAELSALIPEWTEREKMFQKVAYPVATALHKEIDMQVTKIARMLVREKRRAEIMSRNHMHCHTISSNAHRHGIPVVKDEWQCLPNNSLCILVESYDIEAKASGSPIESFRIRKEGAKVGRDRIESVTLKLASAEQTVSAPLFRTLILSGNPEKVLVVESMKKVQALWKCGVDNKTLVMCPKPDANGNERYVILRLTETRIETVKEVVRQCAKK